mmetsp:Transcript_17285/g.19999  ORF Transcript_17285/g.19999 Transcript_17285/m.19999 type:complete len:394 (+) Transcript_17285:104-1285(+)
MVMQTISEEASSRNSNTNINIQLSSSLLSEESSTTSVRSNDHLDDNEEEDPFHDLDSTYTEHKSDTHGNGMDSPTDVRSYRHDIGDTLPIVREGYTLEQQQIQQQLQQHEYHDEIKNVEYDEEFLEYQREEEEFAREMNRTKITFSAYRNAVLYLVHNQSSYIKDLKKNDCSDDNKNDDDHDDGNTVKSEDEANQRMTMLEEIAKEIVETKAKACFEAVSVAKDFQELRQQKRQRQRMLIGSLAGVGGENNILSELRKLKKTSKKKVGNENIPKKVSSEKNKTISKPKSKTNSTKSGPIVRLKKKSTRHADCIKKMLPKFKYTEKEENNENNGPDNGSFKPAKYRTTAWIGGMVKWRMERRKFQETTLTRCGCPDCTTELKILQETIKSSIKL